MKTMGGMIQCSLYEYEHTEDSQDLRLKLIIRVTEGGFRPPVGSEVIIVVDTPSDKQEGAE